MALTNQQKNFCTDMMDTALQMRALIDTMEDLRARWNLNNFFGTITDGDLVLIDGLKHLTVSNLGNAINAFDAVRASLGDDVTGELVNLIKLQG